MSDSAGVIFDQFRNGEMANLERITRAVNENEPEGLYLDFKRNTDNKGQAQSRASDHSKEHLSRMVSAFANTEGGVIVWGVDAKDGKANSADPIPGIRDFVQDINTLTASSTTSIVLGAKTVWVESTSHNGSGYAVTYVPRSFSAPHQSTAPKVKNYWARSGSNCVVMEHRFIQALFEQRAKPILDVVVGPPRYHLDRGNWQVAVFEIKLLNIGELVAREPMIAVVLEADTGILGLGMDPVAGSIGSLRQADGSAISARLFSPQADTRLYPGTSISPYHFAYRFNNDLSRIKNIEFLVQVFCEGFTSELKRFSFRSSQIVVAIRDKFIN